MGVFEASNSRLRVDGYTKCSMTLTLATLSIMTLSLKGFIVTLSIGKTKHSVILCDVNLLIAMLNVVMLSVIMMKVTMLLSR